MTRQHLFTLPVELVLEIARYLSSPSLSDLARTCHRAYDLFNPVLYSVPVNRLCSVLKWANCVGKQQTMHRLLDHNLSGVLKLKHLALWSACSAGYVEIVTRLLDSGVPPDPPCDCHLTLSCVAGVNRKQIIMMLLSAGADLARYNFHEVGELVSGWAPEDRGAPRALVQHGLDIRLVGSNGDNLLHWAVRQNLPTSDVIFLLDEGVDINHRNVDGRTPLAVAIAYDDSSLAERPDIVELLLQRGAKTDFPDNQSWHPLHHAAANAKPWAVRLLSQYGADPDARNSYGQTPLHLCCNYSSRCEKVIKALLDVGASPAAQASTYLGEKRTPMHLALDRCFAARSRSRLRYLFDAWMAMSPTLLSADVAFVAAAALGEVAVLQKLIDSKTVNIEGADGETTALMAAAAAGQDKVIELLLPLVANVDVADGIDHMALHHAVCSGTETPVQLLLPRSSKAWASRNSRVLVITYAIVFQRSPEVLRSLVDADIGDKPRIMFEYMEPADLQPGAHKVPLLFFIRKGYIDIALKIIQQGIGLEGRVEGWTPLRMAAAKGELAVVQALVNAGVDLEVRTDNSTGTALSLAIVNNHIEAAQCLLAAGANTDVPAGDPAGRSVANNRTALTWAVLGGSCEAVRLLLAHSAKQQLERIGKGALYWAMHDGRERIAALLVDAGAPVDEIDRYGRTILSQAASRGKTAIVRILLDAGVRVNLPDRHGRTPFLMAASRGHCEIARLLREKGADTHQRDYFGRSALSLAADQGHDEMVRWLIEQGVDLNEGDRIGRTPLSWAMQMDSAGAVEALVLAGCDVLKPDHYGRTPLQWASSDACIAKLCCSFPGHRRGLRHRLQSGAEACHRLYTGLFCCGLMNRNE